MQILQPPGWKKPRGYSNGILAEGKQIFVGGQIGWDETGSFPHSDFVGQAGLALSNTLAVLKEANARPEHIVRMTWYITDKREYIESVKELGNVYREIIGKHYPAMAMVQVVALMAEQAKVEIESTAVIPVK
jgi:enamine deaminase RidA (YjgF/YER057c/UK114 family)